MNIAIVTHIYQWLEIKHTLIYVLDLHEYHEEEEDKEEEEGDATGTRLTSAFPQAPAASPIVNLRQSIIFNQGGQMNKNKMIEIVWNMFKKIFLIKYNRKIFKLQLYPA